jgi:hypothetical protein
MITIYHKPHSARHSEASFVQALRRQFPDAHYRTENYPIAEQYLHKFVQTQSLLAALDRDQRLPLKQRTMCRSILAACPPHLQVAHDPRRISFDVVMTMENAEYYWEYHESQHRGLTVTRPQQIYDAATGTAITVPRYVQRFVRDIWRLQYFRSYTIVWKDWFETHQTAYQPQLQSGFHEYVLPHTFSFRTFYEPYIVQESQM